MTLSQTTGTIPHTHVVVRLESQDVAEVIVAMIIFMQKLGKDYSEESHFSQHPL